MSRVIEKLTFAGACILVALIATAFFWVIREGFDADRRDDRLQERCMAAGGNWDDGCDMKP